MSENADKKDKAEVQTIKYHKLVSRLKYPVIIKLVDGESIVMAPHGTIRSIDMQTIQSTLPNGIQKVELEG